MDLHKLTLLTRRGRTYDYEYISVGSRLQQIIDGDTTTYQYDAANRLEQLNGQSVYTCDNNGNLLNSDTLTNTWDAANRLTQIVNPKSSIVNRYNGVGDRVGQTTSVTTTYFALDVMGLPEVIYTTEDNLYLHLPGVIMAESGTGEVRYLLSDGLGSVRQATDENGEVVAYNEFDPYGNPVQNDSSPYGFTGEWWASDVSLLHLRARWYAPETGTFLGKDTWSGDAFQPQSMNGWSYVEGNPVLYTDSSGHCPVCVLLLLALLLNSCDAPDLDFTVHFHILDGAEFVNVKEFIDVTNALYAKYDVGVTVKAGQIREYTEEETMRILDGDKLLRDFDEKTNFDPYYREVLNLVSNNFPSGVNAYFVYALQTGINGQTYLPHKAFAVPSFKPSGEYIQDKRTFYHELGHIVHNTEGHKQDKNNYMAGGEYATRVDEINDTQKEEIREFARRND